MLRCRKLLAGIILLLIVGFTLSSYGEDEIEDLIDIAKSEDKIIAIIEGKKTVTYRLRPKEKVLWSGSRGHLGAFLTDHNFFVISTTLNSWQTLPMELGEAGTAVVSLSPFIALLASKDRAVGFDATSNRFVQKRIPIHDELVSAETERFIAVVITSGRAYGFAVESSTFVEITLLKEETIEATKLTFRKVTVRTSDRLLSFEVTDSTWRELRL